MNDGDEQRLIDLAFRRLRRVGNDRAKLPELEQTIVLVASAQGIIDNGGFQYFFEMDFPDRAPYSHLVAAYRAIGATPAATRLERAVRMFPFAAPHRNQKRRNAFMDRLAKAHAFHRLGDKVCGDTSVWKHLSAYIAKHRVELDVPLSRRTGGSDSGSARRRRGGPTTA